MSTPPKAWQEEAAQLYQQLGQLSAQRRDLDVRARRLDSAIDELHDKIAHLVATVELAMQISPPPPLAPPEEPKEE